MDSTAFVLSFSPIVAAPRFGTLQIFIFRFLNLRAFRSMPSLASTAREMQRPSRTRHPGKV